MAVSACYTRRGYNSREQIMLPTPVDSVIHAIGHTPLVRLNRLVAPGSADVVVKLEYFNPTGSYKDRMALAMIEGAERRGVLTPGMRVVEYTGGSTVSPIRATAIRQRNGIFPTSSMAATIGTSTMADPRSPCFTTNRNGPAKINPPNRKRTM